MRSLASTMAAGNAVRRTVFVFGAFDWSFCILVLLAPLAFEGVDGLLELHSSLWTGSLASPELRILGNDSLFSFSLYICERVVVSHPNLNKEAGLQQLASGRVDPSPLVTGTVGLDGVAAAFDDLGRADRHAKVLVDPHRVEDRG